eukprot:Opistho-2@12737
MSVPTYTKGSSKPRPPERGSFPLDHDGECKDSMRVFMDCLARGHYDSSLCRAESKAYLECRMDRDLMAREDLNKLGFGGEARPTDTNAAPPFKPDGPSSQKRTNP